MRTTGVRASVAVALLLGSVATAGVATPASGAAVSANDGPGAGSGWWWDALVVDDVHEETRGEGSTVLLVDGSIDTSVPELGDAGIELAGGCSAYPPESLSMPDSEHGTWMAALIKGTGTGGGISGIAPEADLSYFSLDIDTNRPGIDCKDSAIPDLERIIAGMDQGPILSLSVGNLAIGWEEFQDTLEEAGGVAVASAGDYTDAVGGQGQMDLPAAFPGYVGVLALDQQAQPWTYNPLPYQDGKRYIGHPTISAPGVDIPGFTWQGGRFVTGEPQTGTSPATALVAGSLALVRAKYPEVTGNQLIQHLIHFDTSPEEFGYSDSYGYGVISLLNMMNNDPTLWPDLNPLLGGNPAKVLKLFPMSVYGKTADEVRADWKAMRGRADPTLAPDSDGPARDAAGVLIEEPEESSASEEEAASDGGGSSWAWVLGAVVVAGLGAVGALVLARRRGTRSTTEG